MAERPAVTPRPEFVREEVREHDIGVVLKPLTAWERIWANGWFRKGLILAALALIWQAYGAYLNNALILPTFGATVQSFAERVVTGELPIKALTSVKVLLQGYVIGLVLALAFTIAAITTRIGNDLLELLTAMLNPLPAIALLPLALIWLGLGNPSIIFVLIHAVMWPIALNTHSGFQAVSGTLRMVGRNYGLGGLRMVLQILIPAALPAILSGLKIGWAFAWRTLIAAELVFGSTSGQGGLGWYIFQSRNELFTDKVFAGLAAVILIGLAVEHLVFQTLERMTVRRWGMQR